MVLLVRGPVDKCGEKKKEGQIQGEVEEEKLSGHDPLEVEIEFGRGSIKQVALVQV